MSEKSKGINIRVLPPANSRNAKGKRTWEWPLKKRMFRSNHHVTVYLRQRGERFAGHFHKGEDPSKNPEYFLLLKGRIQVSFQKRGESNQELVVDGKRGPVEITIQPWVLHKMKALAKSIYLEYKPRKFNPTRPDIYSPGEFQAR